METKNWTIALLGACFVMPVAPSAGFAQNIASIPRNESGINLILIPNELDSDTSVAPFIATQKSTELPSLYLDGASTNNISPSKSQSKHEDEDIEDKILALVPHSDKMKKLWNIADGDVDIFVTNLRADRKNKGLSYTTTSLPLIGEMKATEFEFSAGDENEISFESNVMPLVGEVKGFNFKGSLSDKDSNISARYTIAFD